jgi:hypothetical protein
LTNVKRLGRYHNVPNNNSNNDKSNSQLHFSELASLYKDNSRKPSIDFSKPLFGNKRTSLQKLLANANRAKSIPENATIRKEYIKCGKEICQLKHGPYYYAY